MLAYVYNGEKDLGLKEVPDPQTKRDSAVIKVNATSICGTDLRTFRFGSGKIKAPRIIGHEVIGTIIGVGKEIRGFAVGDRVQIAPAIGCGKCSSCLSGHSNLCDDLKTIGFDYDGTFAEYMEIPAEAFLRDYVTKVPASIPSEEAVLSEPIACIMNAQQYLHIEKGNTVVIFGSGFIGTMHAKLALQQGATKVLMIDINESRISMAKSILPELIGVNSLKENLAEIVRAETGGHGADVAITACSVGSAQVDAMNIIAKRGRVSLFGGLPNATTGFIDSNIIHYKEVSVYGSHASTVSQNRKVLDLISAGGFSLRPFIKNAFPLQEIDRAFEELNKESIVKAVLVPGK
jgi:L-iditol 2-dehydrogenase